MVEMDVWEYYRFAFKTKGNGFVLISGAGDGIGDGYGWCDGGEYGYGDDPGLSLLDGSGLGNLDEE